jgi:hypothetical protein
MRQVLFSEWMYEAGKGTYLVGPGRLVHVCVPDSLPFVTLVVETPHTLQVQVQPPGGGTCAGW